MMADLRSVSRTQRVGGCRESGTPSTYCLLKASYGHSKSCGLLVTDVIPLPLMVRISDWRTPTLGGHDGTF